MNSKSTSYIGRFAPSPTGPLHAGSLVAALGSWLDAKAHNGHWLVRVEDIDKPRCIPGTDRIILQQLADVGLIPDEPPVYQSQRGHLYQQALDQLIAQHQAYPCNCSRKEIAEAIAQTQHVKERHGELVYPGTCRAGMNQQKSTKQVAWRFLTTGDIEAQVGDFVLKRADSLWAYQLAVVVDDALQDITHVVRGADLLDNTPRQIALQQALGYPTPHYLHTPLVLAADGEKLSKQNGAKALDVDHPLTTLNSAATVLGLTAQNGNATDALATWTAEWRSLYQSLPVFTSLTIATVIEPNLPPIEAADDVAPPKYLKTIKSFVRRAGRITTGQSKAFVDLGEQFLLTYQPDTNLIHAINLIASKTTNTPATDKNYTKNTSNATNPVVFEIGFGMGEATAHIAALLPETRFLACEVHQPGVGALLKRIGESLETKHPIDNIRIISHDAVEVIDHMLPLASLDGVHIFFPDPWHKKRHNKRRLIQQPLIAKLAARLKVGGYIHCATDWQPYAEQILEVLSAEPLLKNRADPIKDAELAGYSPKPHYRPLTKFENRGIKLGHGVWDVVFERI